MANIAQMINVLQAMILTEKEKMLLTPTYHVFRMYIPFQDATFVPVTYDAGDYTEGDIRLPRVDAIAARDAAGKPVWTNKKDIPYVAFSGKCPHLGCGYKWRQHKVLGQVFLCPCHLSIYDASGKVLDGPAPRPLDALPIKVSASGDVEIIDMEFKAGTKTQIRII